MSHRDDHDPADWEGVDFHVHDDGSHHLRVKVDKRRSSPWRTAVFYRYFKLEIALVCVQMLWTSLSIMIFGLDPWNLATNLAMGILFGTVVYRAVTAYRIGFAMGMQAVPLAMQQPSPKRAAELVQRSCELWDPSPLEVSHSMEVERLEREVNRPKD